MSGFSLKDQLFNLDKVKKLAVEIKTVYPNFKEKEFINKVCSRFPELELKQRILWISDCLKQFLPNSYEDSVNIILNALPKPCNPELKDDDFGDFIYAPYNQYIASYGCRKEYINLSLSALEEITTRFSAEDAIRYFINSFPELTYSFLKKWVNHPHYHVRRLVSEATRPKLPWASKIKYNSDYYLPLLSYLYKDTTRFVTRSVANHLNDLSKINSQLVLSTLEKWKKENFQNEKELHFIIKHSLRTLIKQGDIATLKFLGYKNNVKFNANLNLPETDVLIGEKLLFEIELFAEENSRIIIDYVMFFKGKSGTNEKVFKFKDMYVEKGKKYSFSKTYYFKLGMTTRTFYPGNHSIALQINGTRCDIKNFVLKV